MKRSKKCKLSSPLPIPPTTPPTIAPIGIKGGLRLTVDEIKAVVITGSSDGVRESLAGGAENGPLRLCGGGVRDHSSSGKNQGELGKNQPQLTPAYPSSGLRMKKGVSYAQITRLLCATNLGTKKYIFVSRPRDVAHPVSGSTQSLLRICSGWLTFWLPVC